MKNKFIINFVYEVFKALCYIFLLIFIFQITPYIYGVIPKSNNVTYLYIMGESAIWGMPYRGKVNFVKILDILCDNKIDGKKVEIINLSKPADTLFEQYKKYLRYRLKHPFKKGIVFAYMGNIDTLASEKTDNVHWFSKFLSEIYAFNFFEFLDVFVFRQKYERILKLGLRFKDEFYISTIACNYSSFFPEYYSSLIKNKNLFKEIDELIVKGDFNSAYKKIKEVPITKNMSQINFRIGKIYEKQNKPFEANKEYLNALEYEGYDCPTKPKRYENKIIKELAYKYKIPYFDLFEYMISEDKVIGFNYFMDNAHFVIPVHIKLAKEFASLLKQKGHKLDIMNFSDEHILKKLNFSNKDLFYAYANALGEILVYSYFSSIIPPGVTKREHLLIYASENIDDVYLNIFNIEIIKKYIKLLYELNAEIKDNKEKERETIIHICETIFAYIVADVYKTKQLIIKYNLKDIILKHEKNEIIHCWWFMKHWLIDFIMKNKI